MKSKSLQVTKNSKSNFPLIIMHRTIIHVSLKLYNPTTNSNGAINKIQKALNASVTNLPTKTVTYAFREMI